MTHTTIRYVETKHLTKNKISSILDALEKNDTIFFAQSMFDELIKKIARDYGKTSHKQMTTRMTREGGMTGLGICRRY